MMASAVLREHTREFSDNRTASRRHDTDTARLLRRVWALNRVVARAPAYRLLVDAGFSAPQIDFYLLFKTDRRKKGSRRSHESPRRHRTGNTG